MFITETTNELKNAAVSFFDEIKYSELLLPEKIEIRNIKVNPKVYLSKVESKKNGKYIPVVKVDVEVQITGAIQGELTKQELEKHFNAVTRKFANRLINGVSKILDTITREFPHINNSEYDKTVNAYTESSVKQTGKMFTYTSFVKIVGGWSDK
jgi:hypothetical protein